MNPTNTQLAGNKERQLSILSSCWNLSDEALRECDCVVSLITYFPCINPEQLMREVRVRYLPVIGAKSKIKPFAELYLPTNGRRNILSPRLPIEEAGTLVRFRKHISGKWIALMIPAWNFVRQEEDDMISMLDLECAIEYNRNLSNPSREAI